MANRNGLTHIPQTYLTGSVDSNSYVRKGETVTVNNLEVDGMITIKNGAYDATLEVTGTGNDSYLIEQSDYIQLGNSTSATPHVQVIGSSGVGNVYDSVYNPVSLAPVPVVTLPLNSGQLTVNLDSTYLGKLVLFDTNISAMFTVVCPNVSQAQIGSVIRFCFVGNVSSPNSGVTIKDTFGRTLGVINTDGAPPPTNVTNMITCYAFSVQSPTVSRWCSDGLASVA